MAKKAKKVAKAAPKKAAAKKPVAKKPVAKKPAKKAVASAAKQSAPKKSAPKAAAEKPKRKPNPAFMVALKPSANLAAVIGAAPAPRTEIIKKIWEYIRQNGLQDTANKRMINADAKLKAVFKKDQVSMFDLAKIVNNNVSK
jgi:upstream activation factor subunit UAF30